MDKQLLIEFINRLENMNPREYLLSRLQYETAPTRAGLKPATLMCFSNKGRNLLNTWEALKNQVSKEIGLEYFVLKEAEDYILTLFYIHESLKRHLNKQLNKMYLFSLGYKEWDPLEAVLECLKSRFHTSFPHEIGVFLGVPIRDVKAFIRYKGQKALLCGYWKVYYRLEAAQKLFGLYDKTKVEVINELIELPK